MRAFKVKLLSPSSIGRLRYQSGRRCGWVVVAGQVGRTEGPRTAEIDKRFHVAARWSSWVKE